MIALSEPNHNSSERYVVTIDAFHTLVKKWPEELHDRDPRDRIIFCVLP